MQKLLVLTDFSPSADAALQYATALAQHVGAEILLLHVACPPISPATNFHAHATLLEEEIKMGKQRLAERIQQLESLSYKDGSGNLRVTSILEAEGGIVPTIEEVSKRYKPFMIAMGTHGMTRAEEILLGSVTADVIESEDTPAVLAIPSHATFEEWQRIVYAANYSAKDEKVIEILLELASYFPKVQVDYLHICTHDEERQEDVYRLQELKSAFASIPVSTLDFRLRVNDTIDAGVDEYLASHPTDLLVMLTHHRNFFERLWHRSKAKEMSFHTQVPLLVLKTNISE